MSGDANSFRWKTPALNPRGERTQVSDVRSGSLLADGYTVVDEPQHRGDDGMPSPFGYGRSANRRAGLAQPVFDGPNLDSWTD